MLYSEQLGVNHTRLDHFALLSAAGTAEQYFRAVREVCYIFAGQNIMSETSRRPFFGSESVVRCLRPNSIPPMLCYIVEDVKTFPWNRSARYLKKLFAAADHIFGGASRTTHSTTRLRRDTDTPISLHVTACPYMSVSPSSFYAQATSNSIPGSNPARLLDLFNFFLYIFFFISNFIPNILLFSFISHFQFAIFFCNYHIIIPIIFLFRFVLQLFNILYSVLIFMQCVKNMEITYLMALFPEKGVWGTCPPRKGVCPPAPKKIGTKVTSTIRTQYFANRWSYFPNFLMR